MRLGLIAQLHGRPGEDHEPSWASVRELATTAEAVGFDMFVFEDVLMYRGEEHTDGCWESMTIAAALAEATSTIRFGQSVVNAPYRAPALTASMATTLDEISEGRYVLGVGAGNSPESDYVGFGFPTDQRYSRFAEWIEIVSTLLREGRVDRTGEYWSANGAELVLRGPSPHGPKINIAAGGPKMLALAAQYADEWNWWGWDETIDDISARIGPLMVALDDACESIGRDPQGLVRTIDVYSVVPPGLSADGSTMEQPVSGSAEDIAGFVGELGALGFTEVRVDLTDKTPHGVEAMAPVVDLVHALP
jgi:alkanesulfonate monooxygenase SsuD/methylene tetrahydromethanopterin reductase-like flavin-dependent oxidoreductase (luciferase family)